MTMKGLQTVLNSSSDTPESVLETIGLYQGVLGRLADANGLEYWSALIRDGVELNAVINAFIGSSEFSRLYGNPSEIGQSFAPTLNFVQSLYGNFLGRIADTGGEDFWTDLLIQKKVTVEEVISCFIQSEEFLQISAVPANNWYRNYTLYQEATAAGVTIYNRRVSVT